MNQNDSDSETIIWLNYSLDDLKTAKLILSTKEIFVISASKQLRKQLKQSMFPRINDFIKSMILIH